MKQRTERLALEIQAILGELIARGEIKDPRVRDAGLITITKVRVTGDLREARVGFTVHDADEPRLVRVQRGLASAAAYVQHAVGRRLQMRNTPTLSFEIDRSFDHAFKVEALLKEIATDEQAKVAQPAESTSDGSGEQPEEPGTEP